MNTVVFYRHKCIGCHACVEAAPERWRLSKQDGKAVLIGGYLKKGVYQASIYFPEYEAMREAARQCPAGIIKIR